MAEERLQKILAASGRCSRRAAEQLISAGRVRVNGRVVRELGTKADAHRQKVELDGQRLVAEAPVYVLLNKPRGVVTTLRDPQGRKTIRDCVAGVSARVFPVGRLDFHTSGALLLTNDGAMGEALLRPSAGVPKVYVAKLRGHVDVAELDRLRNGVRLDDGTVTRKAEVFVLREEPRHSWIQITLLEGKNRQIHRMGAAIGRTVLRLSRQSFADLDTDGLRPGESRALNAREVAKLKRRYLRAG